MFRKLFQGGIAWVRTVGKCLNGLHKVCPRAKLCLDKTTPNKPTVFLRVMRETISVAMLRPPRGSLFGSPNAVKQEFLLVREASNYTIRRMWNAPPRIQPFPVN